MTMPLPGTSVLEPSASLPAGPRRAAKSTSPVLLVALALPFLSSPARAEAPCPADYRPLGRIMGVTGTELVISDGSRLRLAAIDVGTGDTADRTALEQILRTEAVGREARIATASKGMDRYGRIVALVRVDEPGISSFENVQESLLRRGFAIARPETGFLGCLPGLVQAEHPARALNLRVWARLPIPARDIEALAARRGGFTIMAGRVRSVGNTRAIDYLNFGAKWREDTTVRVAKTVGSELEQRGVRLDQLAGRFVTVRGHMVADGGPAIDVAWSEQIELSATGPKEATVSSTDLVAEASEAQETRTLETSGKSGAEQAGD